jgi:hypothetical protein
MEKVNHLADFNDLVREAGVAQEAFDQWDQGKTSDGWNPAREVDLATVVQEWDEANLTLLLYVREHGEQIEAEIMAK